MTLLRLPGAGKASVLRWRAGPSAAGQPRLIQVCWSLKAAATRERELAALREAMKELRVRRELILAWLEEHAAQPDIEVQPVWEWPLAEAAAACP